MASPLAPIAHAGELEVRQVVKDENLVAVLMTIDQGDTFTVIAEVFGAGGEGEGAVNRRPYIFPDADSARAFLSEAVTSFTYLGCEIRSL